MFSENKVLLIGRLGGDIELKTTQSGDSVANFSIATDESYRDRSGDLQEKTEWHKCVVWKKTAEIMADKCKKGEQIYIEGKLQTRSWDKNGVTIPTTEIVVLNFIIFK